MSQNLDTIEETTQEQVPVIEPTVVTYGLTPLLKQIYFSNVPIAWKLVIPNELAFTNTNAPFLVIRQSPWSITSGFEDHDPKVPDTFWPIQFSPVQFTEFYLTQESKIKLICLNGFNPHQLMLLSHRYVTGNVQVSIRVTSNTGVSGQFAFTQFENIPRVWEGRITEDGKYLGYTTPLSNRFDAKNTITFNLNDLSLVRHVTFQNAKRDLNKFYDLVTLFHEAKEHFMSDQLLLDKYTNFYTEDFIGCYVNSDITAGTPGNIEIDFFFDYSGVTYSCPTTPTRFDINSNREPVQMDTFYYKGNTHRASNPGGNIAKVRPVTARPGHVESII